MQGMWNGLWHLSLSHICFMRAVKCWWGCLYRYPRPLSLSLFTSIDRRIVDRLGNIEKVLNRIVPQVQRFISSDRTIKTWIRIQTFKTPTMFKPGAQLLPRLIASLVNARSQAIGSSASSHLIKAFSSKSSSFAPPTSTLPVIVEDLHGQSAQSILAESQSQKHGTMRHFTGRLISHLLSYTNHGFV